MFTARFPELKRLFDANARWAEEMNEQDPDFLPGTMKGQFPKFLWFGCADSRVPESVLLEQKPGVLFVHRNIANQFHPEDDSANAVLEYGIGPVGCQHVMIVAHTGCGGCIVAHDSPPPAPQAEETTTPLGRFIAPLIELRHSLPAGADGVNDLILANLRRSVENMTKSPAIQTAWELGRKGELQHIYVHGMIYDMASGRLKDLGLSVGPEGPVSLFDEV
ncbi:carbonic anhydrase [Naematelia encephala]|uniref:Carbonic anhydrase n=1 Tax=Naematelia encephala TaxID=71784 RepID=A0A1Y2BEG4_9TREE|nr:carbonic anhydrase [Naematelia encephala]